MNKLYGDILVVIYLFFPHYMARTGLKPIGPIGPNQTPQLRGPLCRYILSVVQVHTTTHCRFYREQYWAPQLLRPALIVNMIVQQLDLHSPVQIIAQIRNGKSFILQSDKFQTIVDFFPTQIYENTHRQIYIQQTMKQ